MVPTQFLAGQAGVFISSRKEQACLKSSENTLSGTVIKVIGVGARAATPSTNDPKRRGRRRVHRANTDAQLCRALRPRATVQLGSTGWARVQARSRACSGLEARDQIADALRGRTWPYHADGGGTARARHRGRGGGQEMGILTVAVVTKPFSFEGVRARRRPRWASRSCPGTSTR